MIGNYANITISNPAGVTPSAALTSKNITGNLTVAANGVLNNAGLAIALAAGKSFTMQAGSQFNLTGASTMVAVSGGGTKTFNATSTVSYIGTSNQNVTAETYGNLVLGGGTTKTLATGTITVAGNLTLNTGTTYNGATNNPTVNLAGNFAESGIFNSGTGTFTFNGSSAQTLSGTSTNTTFTNLRMNNASGLSINHNVTVSTLLTLTSGVVSTGSNTLITSSNCPGSVSRTSGHVAGLFRLHIPTGSPSCSFDVGDSANYRPVSLVLPSITTAGDLTGSVTQAAGEHPNIATSGIDATADVNRYWTLTNSGVVLGGNYSATFTFVSGDVDGGADATQFEVERWDGSAWNTTTAGTRTTTSTQATGISAFSDFVSGKKKFVFGPGTGTFNAFETATAAGAVTGVIKTRVAGTAFSLDVVAIVGGAQANSFSDNVTVDLIGNNTLGVSLDASNCPTSFSTVLSAFTAAISGGRSTVSIAAVANSWRDVRVRIRWPTSSPTVTSCSTDSFAIRPNTFGNFSVSDNDWQTPGTSRSLNDTTFGSIMHKAGRPFSVRADALNAAGTPAITTNYTGSPAASLTACAGAACTASFGTLSLTTAFVAGQLVSDVATYNQVGSFTVQLVDSAFASIDSADGSTPAERNIQSAAIDVGRFVPDHFAVTKNTPAFGTVCSGGAFTYVGQSFSYTIQPVITVTAQDTSNNTTTLYTGSWWRITNASLTGKAYSALSGTLDTSGAPATDPVIAETGGSPGTGTLTFRSGTGFVFTRTTPVAPFNAEIGLSINVIDADAVAYTANPATVGAATAGNGIAFSSGKEMRFGRLRLQNANGSELLALPIPMETQYFNGTGFVTNTADNCTTIVAPNVGLGNFQFNLTSGATAPSIPAGAFVAGKKTLTLSKPGAGKNGAADVVVNLGSTTTIDMTTTCLAWGATAPTPTGANLPYLLGQWCGANSDRSPTARATFGVYRNIDQFIYQRENF